ncbi:LssY C-terminal domain-containing protein [Alsobacter sp. R-9]
MSAAIDSDGGAGGTRRSTCRLRPRVRRWSGGTVEAGASMAWLKRLGQRLLVAMLGVATVWLIAVLFFDVADRRLPLILALAVSYGVAAYLILPRVVRISARILHRGKVPSYTLTGDGLPGDPVNVALLGSLGDLKRAFAAMGWTQADPLGIGSSWRMAEAFVFNRPYPAAPFSTLYLFDRGQDIGFQLPVGGSPRKRHHVRFWGIPSARVEETLDTTAFWLGSEPPAADEHAVWVGAVTRDTGFSLTRFSFQITHATDADTNAERDYLMAELAKSGVIGPARSYVPGERLTIGKVNRYISDGTIAVADLRPPPPPPGA